MFIGLKFLWPFLVVLNSSSTEIESGRELPKFWEEVQVGDCFTTAELKEVSGVIDGDIYKTKSCGQIQDLGGQAEEVLSCGLVVETGSWAREVVEHDKAGFHFPSPIPCETSTKELNSIYHYYKDISAPEACSEESLELEFTQEEDFKTKKFSAGQGYLYLPNPFRISKFWQSDDQNVAQCDETKMWMAYTGFGNLSAQVERKDCLNDEIKSCRVAKLKASTNEEGKSCVLVTKISFCD